MRVLIMVMGFSWCGACVSAPDVGQAGSSHVGADAGADYVDAGGPVRPPNAPTTFAQPQVAVRPVGGSSGAATAGARAPSAAAAGSTAHAPVAPAPQAPQSPQTPQVSNPTLTQPAAGAAAPMAPRPATPSRPGQLVITEIMVDPKTLSDSDGEWFELQNVSAAALDLQGCTIDDGAKDVRLIATHVIVQALGYLTIARNEQPGFTPGYVDTISFTNSADTIALRCGDVELDRVSYDKARGFALLAGASLSLDPSKTSAESNDDASAWCVARESYGPELGSPGRSNPACEVSDDAGVDAE